MKEQELSAHIQDSIAFLCITSADFLKIARNYVRPEILSTDAVYWAVKSCYKYYDLTKEAPGDHICDAIKDEIKGVSDAKKELVNHFIDRVSRMAAPNMKYVVTKLNEFVKSREFELAAVEFVKLVDKGNLEKAQDLMFNTLKAGIHSEEAGLDYCNSEPHPPVEEDVLVTMGLKHFDCLRTFHRKELVCFMGGYKGKKTWCLVHLGVQGLLRGLNVLHVSHEVSLEEVEERYDRNIGSFGSKWHEHKPIDFTYIDQESGRLQIKSLKRPCITNMKARRKIRKTIKRFGGRLIIRKFPMGSCSNKKLERYMDYLETYEGFVPDILINDYPDIMAPDDASQATRDNLNASYITHKRWADERNMLVAVVSQATRAAIRSKRLTMKDFAEDIRKLGNVDSVIGLCQTDAQALSNLSTLYVVAARRGLMDVGCGTVMNLDAGQVFSDSFPLKLGVKVAEEESDSDKQ